MPSILIVTIVLFVGWLLIRAFINSGKSSLRRPSQPDSLYLFNRARSLHDPYRLIYADPTDASKRSCILPYHKRPSPEEVEALRQNRDLREAEELYLQALAIEQSRAGSLANWDDVSHLSDAINASLEVSLLYRQRQEFDKSIQYANGALRMLHRFSPEIQGHKDKVGMRSEALFRLTEIDQFLGRCPKDELIARYGEILALDDLSRDAAAKRMTTALVEELRR